MRELDFAEKTPEGNLTELACRSFHLNVTIRLIKKGGYVPPFFYYLPDYGVKIPPVVIVRIVVPDVPALIGVATNE